MKTRHFLITSISRRVCCLLFLFALLLGIPVTVQASCSISVVNAGPSRVSSNNTPLTNEVPHIGETYFLMVKLNVVGTTQPFDLKLSMGAQTITWQITNSLTSGGWWWWFPFDSNLDGPIPWQITVDPNKTSGNTNPLNTFSGTFSPIPPTTAVYTYNTNFVVASETNILSFQPGSGTIHDLTVVMGATPDLPTQTILSSNLPSNTQVITTAPQGINVCQITYTNVLAQTFTNTESFTAKLSSLAVNSSLLKQITWSQLSSGIDAYLLPFIQPSTLVQSTDPQITAFVASHLPSNYQSSLSPYEAARELHKAVAGYITYVTPSPGLSALEVLNNKRGDCGTYATLLTACMRNIGIPAKLITGFWTGSTNWHCRMEFYLPTAGWIMADACYSKGTDPTGNYAYYFGNVDNANQFFTMDSGDKKLVSFGNGSIDCPILQAGTFLWTGGANFINDSSYSYLKIYTNQTLGSFVPIPNQTFSNGAKVTIIPPVASSGLPVTITVRSGPATISSNTVTVTGVGTVVLAANQSGDNTYLAASEIITSFDVSKGNQTISFPSVPAQSVTNAPVLLNASSSSGLPVSYSSSSTNISISGNLLTILGAGTASITASQSGNSNWSAATPVIQNFMISGIAQTLGSFAIIPTQTFSNGATVMITPPASTSGLPVTVTVKNGPATISGNTVTLTGPGIVVLAANQSGDSRYAAAKEVTTYLQSFATQTIEAFPPIPPQIFSNGATVSITPPASSSGLPVTVKVKSGPATIFGNTLTLSGAGTVVLGASQGGNGTYSPSGEITTSFTVGKGSQAISFGSLTSSTYGGTPITLSATADSGLPISYASSSTNISISGNVVTISGAGTSTVTATQVGDRDWNPATSVSQNFVIFPAPQNIGDFPLIADQTYRDGATVTITPPVATSGLPVTVSVLSGPATIFGNTVSLTGSGNIVLVAKQSGDANHLPASEISTGFIVSKGSQTISFPTISSMVMTTNPITLPAATASSGLAVLYSVLSGPARVSSNTVTPTGTGSITIQASQPGNANWLPASPVFQGFNVGLGSQSITFTSLGTNSYGTAPYRLTNAFSSSGLPLIYTSSNPKVAKVVGNTLTVVGLGTTTITATQPGDANWLPAPSVSHPLVVGKASQSLPAFQPINPVTFGVTRAISIPTPLPSASSGLPVTVSVKSGPATLKGTTLTITGAGTVTLAANQSGNVNYLPASEVTASFTVQRAGQSIAALPTIGTRTNGSSPFGVKLPAASSGLPVSLSIQSGPARISGTNVTLTGSGTVVIAADQAGNANYLPASTVTTSFPVAKGNQAINFKPPSKVTNRALPIQLSATATSGLPLTYSTSASNILVTTNGLVTILGAGTASITASQPGDPNWNPATSVTQNLVVTVFTALRTR